MTKEKKGAPFFKKISIELLAPAKDLAGGRAAITHGADAVYIGADRFSARAAASNTMADIESLCRFAHGFNAKIYLALNTLLYDDELKNAKTLIHEAWNAGVDAVIFQDMALLEMDLPPIALHASTQMHNMNPKHIAFLEAAGVSRVVLARELDLEAIGRIRKKTNLDLEAFVHGALCVSHSGRCWMSLAMGGRSANRGVCGQPCRLPWDLTDEKGTRISSGKHLLSLKDMDRSAGLLPMLEAGVSSFKIEGRLKDISYVKNVTAFYRKKLDAAMEIWGRGERASHGNSSFTFTPDPAKTFHRGGTDYFLYGRREKIWQMDTPKAMGEKLCRIQGLEGGILLLEEAADLAPGDGLCFLDAAGLMRGLNVNRVEGKKVWPAPGSLTGLKVSDVAGSFLYRNADIRFRRMLESEKSASRKLPVSLVFREGEKDFVLEMKDLSSGLSVEVCADFDLEPAKNPSTVQEAVRRQLEKLGDTPFEAKEILVETGPWFFRASALNALRREAAEKLVLLCLEKYERPRRKQAVQGFDTQPYPEDCLDASFNVSNAMAKAFYEKHGSPVQSMAFEKEGMSPGTRVMTSHHCLRYAFRACPRHHRAEGGGNWHLKGSRASFTLDFDCADCCMHIVSEGALK
ncbi:peptidase U32 family protein [Desulfobotulus mexicanus]|uniref:U32 family peptidase n=1 Tax=Desulfobotulus mexicanus TaxID=2586642 RepID=A0A5Q4VHM8_9BACT|nr:U32 family peptidase [Desulfobotulus mexicanus]TYT75501.1 U32 family peptidase [Desulfobotulus mexicanus]